MQAMVRIDFSWISLHGENPISASLLALARVRLLSGVSETEVRQLPASSQQAAAGIPASGLLASAGPSGGLGRQKPPSGRTRRAIGKQAHRRWPATPVTGSIRAHEPGGRTVRTLRSPRVELRMKKAHEAVAAALMEEEDRAPVVKPNYLVQKVLPKKLWPDGGVVVYAQCPFLLDQSWRSSGAWLSFCHKAVCAPDGRSHGGTYDVFFTLHKENSSGSGGDVVETAGSLDDSVPSLGSNDGISSEDSADDSNIVDYSDDERAPPGSGRMTAGGVGGTPAAGGGGGSAATNRTGRAAAADGGVGASVAVGECGDAIGGRGAAPAVGRGNGPPSADRGGGGNAVADGGVGAPYAGGRGGAPAAGWGGGAPTAGGGGATERAAGDGGAPVAGGRGVSAGAGGDSGAPVAGADIGAPVVEGGSSGAQVVDGVGGPVGRATGRVGVRRIGELSAPVAPASAGLHHLLLQAIRSANLYIVQDVEERVSVCTLAQSPPSSFFMNCSFYTDMDLDTTDPDQLSCQTDSYISPAYRARPRTTPSVRKVYGCCFIALLSYMYHSRIFVHKDNLMSCALLEGGKLPLEGRGPLCGPGRWRAGRRRSGRELVMGSGGQTACEGDGAVAVVAAAVCGRRRRYVAPPCGPGRWRPRCGTGRWKRGNGREISGALDAGQEGGNAAVGGGGCAAAVGGIRRR